MAGIAPFANLEANFIGERFGPQLGKFLAQQLEKSGMHPEKIFQQTGWFKNLADEWSYEVAPKGPRLTPEATKNLGPSEMMVKKPSTEPNRQPSIERFDPNYPAEPLHSNTKSARLKHDPGDPFEARWAEQKEIPNVGDVFEDSDLFGYVPELRNSTALLTQPSSFFTGGGAPWDTYHGGYGYSPSLGHAIQAHGLNAPSVMKKGQTPFDAATTHEFQHNINALQGSPTGGNPDNIDPAIGGQVLAQAQRMNDDLYQYENAFPSNPVVAGLYERYNRLLQKAFQHEQRGVSDEAIGRQVGYEASVGETEARNAETRARMLGGIPMTDTPKEAALRKRLTGQDYKGERAADVHPFRTMDYPPDLQYLHYDASLPIDAKTKPAGYLYNWMYP